jgi:sterol desaturase/sphingolipid hydroxylase (fatty acid hydroxylase superfamily)
MINDADYGKRDKRGDWTPTARIKYPPAPWKVFAFLKWLFGFPGYLWPWSSAYLIVTALLWFYATPSMETMKTFSVGWIAFLLVRNLAVVLVVFGAWHYFLYIRKSQGKTFKLNGRWPSTDNSAFLFKNQNVDNVIWSLASGVPIWTAFEAIAYWVFANGYVPWVNWSDNPIYFVLILAITPALHDVHFYCVHRLLHWPPLYKWVHTVHHNAVNVGPWSGLAMHPVEHIFYFSGIFLHFLIPSHPFHAMFHGFVSALGPARGHAGFEKLVIGDQVVEVKCHQHYLHHKYFECNYGDGPVPLDKWMGTHHDGSPEAQEAMTKRYMERAAKAQSQSKSA